MPVKPRLPEHTVYNHNRYPSDTVLQEGLAHNMKAPHCLRWSAWKPPYRDKFARYYSRPYTPHNSRLMQSLGWLTPTQNETLSTPKWLKPPLYQTGRARLLDAAQWWFMGRNCPCALRFFICWWTVLHFSQGETTAQQQAERLLFREVVKSRMRQQLESEAISEIARDLKAAF